MAIFVGNQDRTFDDLIRLMSVFNSIDALNLRKQSVGGIADTSQEYIPEDTLKKEALARGVSQEDIDTFSKQAPVEQSIFNEVWDKANQDNLQNKKRSKTIVPEPDKTPDLNTLLYGEGEKFYKTRPSYEAALLKRWSQLPEASKWSPETIVKFAEASERTAPNFKQQGGNAAWDKILAIAGRRMTGAGTGTGKPPVYDWVALPKTWDSNIPPQPVSNSELANVRASGQYLLVPKTQYNEETKTYNKIFSSMKDPNKAIEIQEQYASDPKFNYYLGIGNQTVTKTTEEPKTLAGIKIPFTGGGAKIEISKKTQAEARDILARWNAGDRNFKNYTREELELLQEILSGVQSSAPQSNVNKGGIKISTGMVKY